MRVINLRLLGSILRFAKEKSLSSEANISSASQETPHFMKHENYLAL